MGKLIICAGCGAKKQHMAFGLGRRCYDRKRYQEQRQQVLARNRQWRKQNPDKAKAYQRHHYGKHRDEVIARSAHYAQAYPDRVATYKRRWRRGNPDKIRIKEARRRALKRNLPDTLTVTEGQGILAIGRIIYPGEKLHLDHIVPVSKGGGTTLANIQAIPASLNMFKRDALPQSVYEQLTISGAERRDR